METNVARGCCRLPAIASSLGEHIQDQHMFRVPALMSSFGAKLNNFIGWKT